MSTAFILSLLACLCIITFFVSVVLLVLRIVKRRPWKLCAKVIVLSALGFYWFGMAVNQTQTPAQKQDTTTAGSVAVAVDPTANVNKPVDSVEPHKHPLYTAEIHTVDVMSGTGENKVGTRSWVKMSKSSMLELSQKEFVDYALNVISKRLKEDNWFSIFMDDGTGINFNTPDIFDYGVIQDDGSLKKRLGIGMINEDNSAFKYSALSEDTSVSKSESSKSTTLETTSKFEKTNAQSIAKTYKTSVIVASKMFLDRFLTNYSVSLASQSWTVADFDSNGAVIALVDVKLKSLGRIDRAMLVLTPVIKNGKVTAATPHYIAVGNTVFGDDGYCTPVFSKLKDAEAAFSDKK